MITRKNSNRGLAVIVSAPSGGGKSTIVSKVLSKLSQSVRSISCTTRAPRPGEKNGRDYFFITPQQFRQKIKEKDFLEWAMVHDNYYGTPLSYVTKMMDKGNDVFFTIDPQGARALQKKIKNAVYIFIVPPSWRILKTRLVARGDVSESQLRVRLANAKKEVQTIPHYDYLVVNEKLDQAVNSVINIVTSEHLKIKRLNRKNIPLLSEDA